MNTPQLPGIRRAHVPMPTTTTIALLAMVASAGLTVVNFIPVALESVNGSGGALSVALLAIGFPVVIAPPLLAAGGLRGGRRWAPVLVTAVGAWGCALLLQFQDVLTWVDAAIGIAAIVAVWMPSARAFTRESAQRRRRE